MPKKNILILFNGDHLAYSPTIIQLCEFLSDSHNITIFALKPKKFKELSLKNVKIEYYDEIKSKLGLKEKIKSFFLYYSKNKIYLNFSRNFGNDTDFFFFLKPLEKLIKKNEQIIAVDIKNLAFSTLFNRKTHFLSLELCSDEEYLEKVDKKLISSVVIQSKARYDYLFKEEKHKTFFVQNAPVYKPIPQVENREGLIYAGTAFDAFGFYHCLKFLDENPKEKMYVQGALIYDSEKFVNENYNHLIESGRLKINSTYLENDEVNNLINQFEIGFCFYDFSIPWVNNFNYQSAPSGKLFKYLAMGVPVVCNDIIGFQFIKDKNCGVLVKDMEPQTIKNAIDQIRENYQLFSDNARMVAQEVSFDKMVQPFISYLKNE